MKLIGKILSRIFCSLLHYLLIATVSGKDHNHHNHHHHHVQQWAKLENWTRNYLINVTNYFQTNRNQWTSFKQSSADCQQSLINLSNGLNNLDLQSVKTLDAWGRIPSGLLSGSFSQLGSFDECVDNDYNQYCLMFINMPLGTSLKLAGVFRRYSSNHFNFSSETFQWFSKYANILSGNNITIGMCLPNSCNQQEILSMSREVINFYGLPFKVNVDLCQTRNGLETIHLREVVCLIIVLIVIILNIWGNFVDKNNILAMFSFKQNIRKIFLHKRDTRMSPFIDGIKTLNMALIIFGHAIITIIPAAYENTFIVTSFHNQPAVYLAHLVPFAVDTFFLITGYEIMSYFIRGKHELKIKPYLLIRWLRFIPSIGWFICLYILTFSEHVKRLIGGPFWHYYEAAGSHPETCAKMWIYHVFLIGHYFYWKPDVKTCLMADWYLESDYVYSLLFLLILIPFMKKRTNVAIINCIGLILMGSIAIVVIAYLFDLQTTWIPFSFRSSDFIRYLAYLHGKPWGHLSPYFIGVALAILMSKINCKISQPMILFYWFLWWIGLSSLIAYEAIINFNWLPISSEVSLLYGAMSKIIWSALICWMIFICHFGYAHRWINKFLSWPGFRVCSRLNLSALFVNIYLIRLRNATNRTTKHYSLGELLLDTGIPMIIYTYIIALFNCTLIEVPVINLLRKIFAPNKPQTINTNLPESSSLIKSREESKQTIDNNNNNNNK